MFHEMRALSVLADVGSIQRTAERLLRTQSAVTRQIQRLEDDLGVKLLDRRAKPPTLTPVGRMVLERCRLILRSVAELKSSVSSDGEPSGTLRIGLGNALADDDMADRLRDLGRRFPRLTIHIKTDWTPALIQNVSQGLLDAAIAPKRPEMILPQDVAGSVIGLEPLAFVAAGDCTVARRASLKHLATRQWVVKPAGCGTRETLRLMLERQALPFNIAAEVPDENIQLSLIARGLGVGLVSMRSVRRHAQRDEVRVLDVPRAKAFLEVAVVRSGFLGCLGAAIDVLEKEFAGRYGEPPPRRPPAGAG
jgi:DNA-binding transcriptional LysR family regulator